ncbi:hypothetical protein B0H17DRAFT_1055565 [Mycena rosella]|uniref:FAD/NAD(P)-binding domain-containing protein n=1 Tax=Mycena rosella TaxID=1033263 RepID=A0AAD7GN95_MYCRO|nr:hypothetical protein B0H17DRAFT_1055565 [Mycena rosella]
MSPRPAHTFTRRVLASGCSDAAVLNSNNINPASPASTDVTVVGGGIHSLIYSIHAKKASPSISISVFEKSSSPGYKIGESTLTTFNTWLKTIGLHAPLLLRLFGVKDGLAAEEYTEFCANGPPGDFVPTLQVERKISQLLLSLVAQRMGVNMYHSHAVDINQTTLAERNCYVVVKDIDAAGRTGRSCKLVIDATGRFRRFASKEARVKRFEGWNTNAFWAYFEADDESTIPFRNYESCNTNHLCMPEGWGWVIRLPCWEGSPVANLMDMITYLLELNDAGVPSDEYPSSEALAKMFDLKFRWVVSIGFALRTDVVYPADMTPYGTKEGEQKFNWIVSRYQKLFEFMKHHRLIENLYGPGTTWYIRKQLAFQSTKVSGPGFVAIGDATAFTNPLYSPGINANMATSVYAAELTPTLLDPRSRSAEILQPYEAFCASRAEALHRMNRFNYLCMRSKYLGAIGPTWQYLCGTGMKPWQNLRQYTFEDVSEVVCAWDWGAREEPYIAFADKVIALLEGPADRPVSDAVIQEVLALSRSERKKIMGKGDGQYFNRWSGLLRFYDDDLEYHADKTWKDVLARRCGHCRNWRLLRQDWRVCMTCGTHQPEDQCKMVIAGPVRANAASCC